MFILQLWFTCESILKQLVEASNKLPETFLLRFFLFVTTPPLLCTIIHTYISIYTSSSPLILSTQTRFLQNLNHHFHLFLFKKQKQKNRKKKKLSYYPINFFGLKMVKEVKQVRNLGEVAPALFISQKKSSTFTKLEPIIEEAGSEGFEVSQKGSLFYLPLLFSAVFFLVLSTDFSFWEESEENPLKFEKSEENPLKFGPRLDIV